MTESKRHAEATSGDVSRDQLALIKIEGMHCHQCEASIRRHVQRIKGVFEIETDFASGQASVLFDPRSATVDELAEAVEAAGYHVTGHVLGRTET